MAQKHRHNQQRKRSPRGGNAPQQTMSREPIVYEKKVPIQYGLPYTILEDTQKNTFEYKSGAWVPHGMTIAECRVECQVKELPQKVNQMTRYEIRCPLPT